MQLGIVGYVFVNQSINVTVITGMIVFYILVQLVVMFANAVNNQRSFIIIHENQGGSGKTRDWINAYNINKPFTRVVSGMGNDLSHRYYPQDLCDECIDLLLGWAWRNLRPLDPYWSNKIFTFNDKDKDSYDYLEINF